MDRVRRELARLCASGRSPSIRELARASGLPRSTVHRYVDYLIDAGEVTHRAGRWRSITPNVPRTSIGGLAHK